MPFSGANDPDLPSNVQRLPAKKRRQWVAVWNSTFSSCTGSRKTCESRAFAAANGVVKKELGMAEEDPNDAPEEKDHYLAEESGAVIAIMPLGGATSFSEADAFRQAQDDLSTFKVLLDNIVHCGDEDQDLGAAVASLGREFSQRQQGGGSRSIADRVKSWFGGEKVADHESGAFFVLKDVSGGWRWLALVTNQFYDRDGEVFPEAAHREHEEYLDRTNDFPELRLWHTPGSKMGVADFFTFADGFVVSSGTFDPGFEDVAKALSEMRGGLGVSHGFVHPASSPTKDGVYTRYRMIEISPLPAMEAANIWTEFSAENMKEVQEAMSLQPKKREFLVSVLGEKRTHRIEEYLPGLEKELKEGGVSFKALGEGLASVGEEAEEEQEEESPEEAEEETPKGEESSEEKPAEEEEETEEEEVSLESAVKAINAIGGKMEKFSELLDERFDEVGARLKELEKSDDEKIAAAMHPRGGNGSTRRPSESEDTEIDDKDAEESIGQQGTGDSKDGRPTNPARQYVEDMMRPGARS